MATSSWPNQSKGSKTQQCDNLAGCVPLPTTSEIGAFMRINIHTDGGVSIDSSEHVQSCIGMSNTQRLLQQLRRAYQAHITKKHDSTTPKTVREQARGGRSRKRSISRGAVVKSDDKVNSTQHDDSKAHSVESRRQVIALNKRHLAKDNTTAKAPDYPPKQAACETFVISDKDKLREYYLYLFQGLQQAAVKRIAKLWIKGICPRKQATFPYQSSETVPQWWPSAELCPFTEPDHIKKDERLELCLHLLRLRPDPEVLKAWNGNTIDAHPSHVRDGWTAFLEHIAPPTSLLDARENVEATVKRAEFLKKLYEVARIEETFNDGGVDASYQIQWPREELQAPAPRRRSQRTSDDDTILTTKSKKRKRRPSKGATTSTGSSIKQKKSRKQAPKDTAGKAVETAETCHFADDDTVPDEDTTYQEQELGYRLLNPVEDECESFYPAQQGTRSGSFPTLTWTHNESADVPRHGTESLTTSFTSTTSSFYPTSTATSFMVDSIHDPMQSATDGHNHIHEIPRTMRDDDAHLQQPYCDTVPNSPILSNSALAHSKSKREKDLGVGLAQHPWFNTSNAPAPSTFFNNFYSSASSESPIIFNPSYMTQPGIEPTAIHGSSASDLPILSRFLPTTVKGEPQRYYCDNFHH